jgi:hypothetical protein
MVACTGRRGDTHRSWSQRRNITAAALTVSPGGHLAGQCASDERYVQYRPRHRDDHQNRGGYDPDSAIETQVISRLYSADVVVAVQGRCGSTLAV